MIRRHESTEPNCVKDANTTYTGSTFALSNQTCSSGSVQYGVNTNGTAKCTAVSNARLGSNAVTRAKISGTEVMLYTINKGCSGTGDATTTSTCKTAICMTTFGTWYFKCDGTCAFGTAQQTCNNVKLGYLLSPSIAN